jgi:uncharacterized membrane protein
LKQGRDGANIHTMITQTYLLLAYAHLATIVPAFAIGTWLMFSRKGSAKHRGWGKAYMALMLVSAGFSLFMPAVVGPRFLNHFGFIHLFSISVFFTIPMALRAAMRHDIRTHQGNMIGLYVGGLLIAGAFAFTPGRMLHTWLFA